MICVILHVRLILKCTNEITPFVLLKSYFEVFIFLLLLTVYLIFA